jgi:hypothetical protein
VVAIAPELQQELSDVRLGRQEDEKDRFGRHRRDDGHAAAILEHGSEQFGTPHRGAQLVGGSYDRRNQSRYPLGVDPGYCLAIDKETVAPEHDGRFDSFALSNCSHEIPDACHLDSSRQVVAKLEIVISEVKR